MVAKPRAKWMKDPTWSRRMWVAFHAVVSYRPASHTWPTSEAVAYDVTTSTLKPVRLQMAASILKEWRRIESRQNGPRVYDRVTEIARSRVGCTTKEEARFWVLGRIFKALHDKVLMRQVVDKHQWIPGAEQ